MATRGENCNDWPRTVMTGGCLLVAFAPDGATGNDDKHLDSFWNNDFLIVIFSSLFLQEQAQTSKNKCRTVFNTCKQTHMRILELFLTMFNLAKNLMCGSCPHAFNFTLTGTSNGGHICGTTWRISVNLLAFTVLALSGGRKSV